MFIIVLRLGKVRLEFKSPYPTGDRDRKKKTHTSFFVLKELMEGGSLQGSGIGHQTKNYLRPISLLPKKLV